MNNIQIKLLYLFFYYCLFKRYFLIQKYSQFMHEYFITYHINIHNLCMNILKISHKYSVNSSNKIPLHDVSKSILLIAIKNIKWSVFYNYTGLFYQYKMQEFSICNACQGRVQVKYGKFSSYLKT